MNAIAAISAQTPTEYNVGFLRLMLGRVDDAKPSSWGRTNRFSTGGMFRDDMDRLVGAGLAELCPKLNVFPESTGGLRYYRATAAGCALAGLDASATKRALSA